MESLQEYDKSISCIDRANFVQIEEISQLFGHESDYQSHKG